MQLHAGGVFLPYNKPSRRVLFSLKTIKIKLLL
jgi:hypothetical protein